MSTLRMSAEDGRQVGVLTRADIIEALREYAARYGDDFPQGAFAPSQAKRNGRPELVERYYAGRADGRPWPSLNAVKAKFDGSWNAARAAAGFAPNSTGPRGGRRPGGAAEPILTVREHIRFLPSEKTKEIAARAARLEERLARALERAREAERKLAERPRVEVRERRLPPEVRTKVEVKTKTVTKTVKVKDQRAVDRARVRLADEQAARRAVEDQLRAEQRDRNRDFARLSALESEVESARVSLAEAVRDRDHATDRLVAAEALMTALRGEIAEARQELVGVSEAVRVSELVQHADRRANEAEVRAARAEREMVEQAAAITGERRKLTQDELAELRRRGPSGPSVLATALNALAVARKRGGSDPLRAALTEVASAAVMWRDQIR